MFCSAFAHGYKAVTGHKYHVANYFVPFKAVGLAKVFAKRLHTTCCGARRKFRIGIYT